MFLLHTSPMIYIACLSSSFLSSQAYRLFVPVSFYKFKSYDFVDDMLVNARKLLTEYEVKGTLTLSPEGYNAQISIPSTNQDEILAEMKTILNDTKLEFNRGHFYDDETLLPYNKLVVKKKDTIITDGFPKNATFKDTIGYDDCGVELEASEWQSHLLNDSDAIVLDCRNTYESNIGKFIGSIPLNTNIYSESFEVLDKIIQNETTSQNIYAYCTGAHSSISSVHYLI